MTERIVSDKWHGGLAGVIVTTITDTAYANGAVQPGLFSEEGE